MGWRCQEHDIVRTAARLFIRPPRPRQRPRRGADRTYEAAGGAKAAAMVERARPIAALVLDAITRQTAGTPRPAPGAAFSTGRSRSAGRAAEQQLAGEYRSALSERATGRRLLHRKAPHMCDDKSRLRGAKKAPPPWRFFPEVRSRPGA